MTESRAAVTTAPGRVETRTFPLADPEPGAVIMRVHLSGICGTDKHTYRGESKQYAGTPHERDITYPLICGHENVGTVVATGGDVVAYDGTLLRPGDRIVPGANVPCGRCRYCQGDYPYYFCQHLEDYGNSLNCIEPPYLFGGWSEYMYLLPRTPLFRVPDAVPDEAACITEVMAVTHGIERAGQVLASYGGNPAGFSVAVLGLGPLGLCHLVKARLMGAGLVVASDILPERLGHAAPFGVDLALDAGATDAQQRYQAVLDATDGLGVDIVVDASGVTSTFTESLRLVRTGGVVVEAGTFVDMGPVAMNPNSDVCTRNVTIMGIGGETAAAYPASLALMAANMDRYPIAGIVSHVYGLDEADEAVRAAQQGHTMQVAIDPRRPAADR